MTHIITDTTSTLTSAEAADLGIPVIPQIVNFGEESYYEGRDIDITTFLRRLQSSKVLPKTAAPPPELFSQLFQRLVPTGETIICIHPSAEVSGTVRSATVAAMDFPNADIRVIDTRMVASPMATLVLLADRWAKEGQTADFIETQIRAMIPRCRIYFLVDTLEYLARGGRIGGAAALLGSVLQIKPILMMQDGKVNQFEKERTHRRALARLKQVVQEQIAPGEMGYLSVMHAGVLEQGTALAEDLKTTLGLAHVPVREVPPAIITHGGPGILGVGFFVA
jgi:DegV family protein with EDD domain